MKSIGIAVVGLGKIAREQHLPAIRASKAFELVAVASPHSRLEGCPSYATLESLLEAHREVRAVALCMPPQTRAAIARVAIRHGCHVLLEKPPGTSVIEVEELSALASHHRSSLFAAWHSRFGCAVEPARALLADRTIRRVVVTWQEDVRVWHPGQDWIWAADGLGVFDPGINALSILSRIAPDKLVPVCADLWYPANCEAPSAARLTMDLAGAPVEMHLDFLHAGAPRWDIEIETDLGRILLAAGGNVLVVDGCRVEVAHTPEYEELYDRFAELIHDGRSDVDLAPMSLMTDALSRARRIAAAPFSWIESTHKGREA